jgi:beta-glucanase (GH16 family)
MRASSIATVAVSVWLAGCGSNAADAHDSNGNGGAGGNSAIGGSAGSGASAVAAAGSSASSAGAPNTGSSTGGATNGGAPNGGAPNAGATNGGATSAGASGASAGGSGGEAITTPAGYKLVWHDEFDTDGAPDPANWKFEKGFVRNEARKETVQNTNYTGTGDWKTTRQTADYTSSSINTSGLQSFQYGHFELRARIPTDAGMWPAWWTLGVSGEWPSNGEIDIMEYYQNKVLANVACGTSTRYVAKWDSASKPLSALGADWSSNFHIWTMDWDDQNIVLSLDGAQMNSTALSAALNSDGTSPFKQKAYILLNLAIGGQNGGDPSQTTFPKRYEIDYVRVFQKQ